MIYVGVPYIRELNLNLLILEFAESLQHTSKSVERYPFLIWILCTHCGLFYYLNV